MESKRYFTKNISVHSKLHNFENSFAVVPHCRNQKNQSLTFQLKATYNNNSCANKHVVHINSTYNIFAFVNTCQNFVFILQYDGNSIK